MSEIVERLLVLALERILSISAGVDLKHMELILQRKLLIMLNID